MLKNRLLIGREAERAALEATAASVREGLGRCVLVTGEAGIGKTRLVAHALERADLITYAGAARSSVGEPYAPVAQVLRECLRRSPGLLEACGPLAPYLAPLLPELGLPAQDAGEAALVEALQRAFAGAGRCGPAASCSTTCTGRTRPRLRSCPSSRAGFATCRCCSSPWRATRCRPTRTDSAACARTCAANAICSSFPCARSTGRTPRGSPPRSPERSSRTTWSPTCTSAPTASRSTSRNWRRRSRCPGGAPRPAGCRCPRPCSTPSSCAPRHCRSRRGMPSRRRPWWASAATSSMSRHWAPMRSPRRWPPGSWSTPGPAASSSGTRSSAMPCTRRSPGRAAARCTRRSPVCSRGPAPRRQSGPRSGSEPAISSVRGPRSPRPRPPPPASSRIAMRGASTSGRSISPGARSPCASSCSSDSRSARSSRAISPHRPVPGAR